MRGRILIRIAIIIIVLAGIGSYSLYASRKLLLGPIITIESPINGATVANAVADIKGKVQNISHIWMNDRDISIDENGAFNEKFVLSNGSNFVKVSAEDRFGRKTEKYVEVIYNKPSEPLVKRDSSEFQ